MIKIEDVSREFSIRRGLKSIRFYAVKDVTLGIPKGAVLGIVGESGSGKTTLGKMTLAALKPTKGRILYEEIDIFRFVREQGNRRLLQYIPQDPYASLNPYKTIKQLLMEPILHHKLAKDRDEALSMIYETMMNVGLTPPERYLNMYPPELSGGEKQRVNIARALIVKPTYVVADEPTTMLDASLKSGIITTLRNLIEKTRITLSFITHEMSLLQFFGSECLVAVMYLGKIVEQGTLKKILSEPLHPYTKALISAIPIPDPKLKSERKLLLKEAPPPSPLSRPPGCPLSDRCPYVTPSCTKEDPLLKVAGIHHKVACVLY